LHFRTYRGPALASTGAAAWATFRRDTTDLRAQLISIQIPGRTGEPDLAIEAPEGAGNLKERRFNVWGGVVARRARDVGRTERAHYQDGLVEGETPVTIRGQGWSLDGPGFTAEPDSGLVRIRGGGKLVFRGGAR
jgi:hypothetical protein